MELKVVFLGTSGSMPTPERNLPSIALRRGRELFLFDVGEGTQRQLLKAGMGFKQKTYIFITHLHLDHVSGLPGIIHTLSLLQRKAPLMVFGPPGTLDYVRSTIRRVGNLPFKVVVKEVSAGVVLRGPDYTVYAAWADHSCPCLAYAFVEDERPGRFYPERARALGVPEGPLWKRLQSGKPVILTTGKVVKPEDVCGPKRPGRKVVYSGDTRPCDSVVKLAEGADVLIHDSMFGEDMADRALEDGHSTASQAAEVARRAGVLKLYLTHISPRYRDATPLLEEAVKVFPFTTLAEDLMEVDVKFRETPVGEECT